jgi:hypothetical protein
MIYFIYFYENRTVNPGKIVFKGVRGMRENDGGYESNQGKLLKFILFLLYCCAGWRYTVAFTKVLIVYQIYHT